MLKDIKEDLRKRMTNYNDSCQPTADEVRIAWLVGEVERLDEKVKSLVVLGITTEVFKTNHLHNKRYYTTEVVDVTQLTYTEQREIECEIVMGIRPAHWFDPNHKDYERWQKIVKKYIKAGLTRITL